MLEHGVGVTLLDRDQSGVRLTPVGNTLQASAAEILQRAEAAILSAQQAERGEIGALAIGFVPSAALDFVPRIIVALKERLPDVTFTATEMMSYEIVEALQSGQLDIGLTHAQTTQGGLESQGAVSEPFVLAVPRNHSLATASLVTLPDLDGLAMIGYSADRGGVLRDIHHAAFAATGVHPAIMQEISQTQTVIALVDSDLGVALVLRSAHAMQMANTVFIPMDLPARYRSVLHLNKSPNRHGLLHDRAREIVMAALEPVAG